MIKYGVIIVAAGSGKRMNNETKKQFLKLCGKEIFIMATEKFEAISEISQIVIVVAEEDLDLASKIIQGYGLIKTKVVSGGKERQDSVYNGLKALDADTDIVLIHDGVRPFVSKKNIDDVIEKTKDKGACVLATPVKDTVKVCEEGLIKRTVDRKKLWAIQTPQGFNYKVILAAYEALGTIISVTDDAQLVEEAGYTVCVVEGSYKNIKITTPEDLVFGEAILKGGEFYNENS